MGWIMLEEAAVAAVSSLSLSLLRYLEVLQCRDGLRDGNINCSTSVALTA